MINFISNLKYDLEKTFRELGHNIYSLRVTNLVKENEHYRISGTCEDLFLDIFGSHKILDFTATYDPINREITAFEVTSRVKI
jgi:hypothetical protein